MKIRLSTKYLIQQGYVIYCGSGKIGGGLKLKRRLYVGR